MTAPAEGGPTWPYNLGVDERLFALISIGLGHDYYAIDLGLRADLEAEIQGELGDIASEKDRDDANECAESWHDRLAHLRKNLYEALERDDLDTPNEFDTTPEPDADDDVLDLVRDAIGTDELTRYRAAMDVDDVERLAGAFDDADEALECSRAISTLANGIGMRVGLRAGLETPETVASAALRGFERLADAMDLPEAATAQDLPEAALGAIDTEAALGAIDTARIVADRVIEYLREAKPERPDDPTKTPAKPPINFGDII